MLDAGCWGTWHRADFVIVDGRGRNVDAGGWALFVAVATVQ